MNSQKSYLDDGNDDTEFNIFMERVNKLGDMKNVRFQNFFLLAPVLYMFSNSMNPKNPTQ